MFKVGDKVRVIATQERLDELGASDLTPQQEYEVTKFSGSDWIQLDGFTFGHCQQEDIELARNTLKVELESKYAFGDEILIGGNGKIYEITQIVYENGKFDYGFDDESVCWTEEELDNEFKDGRMSFFTEPEVLEVTMEELEEKFGTKVKIVK